MVGTAAYSAISTRDLKTHGFYMDVESLCYVMAKLVLGHLPWDKYAKGRRKDYGKVSRRKIRWGKSMSKKLP